MSNIKAVRGTHDLIGEEQRRHAYIVYRAKQVATSYGFEEWSTPIFEETKVFSRSLGETSDIVSKEMYSFLDRGGESLTLRPEGTAAICRALVTNGLTQTLPQKVFYAGPMFRYERPQKGRYRQFHQIGAELLGAAEPLADAEMLAMAANILEQLGIGASVTLKLNTLGDQPSRMAWREALVTYFREVKDQLSSESQERLERNPLRILDSKDEKDKNFVRLAPCIEAFLTREAQIFWDDLRKMLDIFGISYEEDPSIVRGLDYYSHTTFEFVTTELGAQGTVLAGGRYNGLVQEMGGPAVPAIGWAAGVERLAMLVTTMPEKNRSVSVIPVGEEALAAGVAIMQQLRLLGVEVEMAYKGNMKKRMERANKIHASYVLIIGEEEMKTGVIQIKNMETGLQETIHQHDIGRYFTSSQVRA
ncbi:histidine--tRNA ligase [Entomobacter blattae]|uniref:Histidine--tRNA ligase n=1 Tax=Entomobacter blattae TaxID=2762277 RepID=A0A7H1NTM1_9PROT|nr:histidine--tRNA ligase [Entomobacter blattae]QNT79131.1 Histidine--tRNA ligase [Entomobacter blattae]